MSHRSRWAALGLVGLACGGAGIGTPFNTNWENDAGRSISELQRRLAGAKAESGPGVAVGITSQGLVGATLDGAAQWQYAGKLDSRPSIAGGVVVGSGDGHVFALDAKTGKRLWSVDSDGRSLRGAGDDGDVTVVSLGARDGGGSRLIAVSRSGSVLRSFEPEPEIGTPAVLGGVAFVPWGNQYVTAIDLATGDEVARLLLRDKVSRVLEYGGRLYFGEIGVVRFDDKIGAAVNNQATRLELPETDFPGEPRWLGYGAAVTPKVANANDSVRFYARPAADGGSFDTDRYASTYFRVAIGMKAGDGAIAWVRTLERSLIGGDAAQGGFAFCDSSGDVWMLGAKGGADAGKVSLGKKLQACVVRGGDFQVQAKGAAQSLGEQLGEAIKLRMPQMVAAQQYLLKRLAAIEDPKVTGVLIDVVSNPDTPPVLAKQAGKVLAERRTGEEFMLEALGRHYDFLAGTLRPPPVGALAQALAAIGERSAAPLLAKHLNDPANPPEDIKHVAAALEGLAGSEEVEELRTFFALYRATADQGDLVAATISVANALVRVGGQTGKDAVERAREDPLTHPEIKAALADIKIRRKRERPKDDEPAAEAKN